MGRRPDEGGTVLTRERSFWDWSVDVYARAGMETLLLTLQDRHGLSVNMLLWCLWSGAHFETPGDLVLRKGDDLSRRWTASVTAPLRAARRALSQPPIPAPSEEASALREQVKENELAAERLEQSALERLALEHLTRAGDPAGAADRARKALASYVRLTGAARTPGFSVSLLEDLIGLSLPPSESDGECVG